MSNYQKYMATQMQDNEEIKESFDYELAREYPAVAEMIDSLRAQLEEANKQRDFLVELCATAARWPDSCKTYTHAIGHIENVISNLRCDKRTAEQMEKKARSEAEALRAEVEELKDNLEAEQTGNRTQLDIINYQESIILKLESRLSRYEQGIEVEGIIYSNYVLSTFGEPYNRIGLLRVPNMPDIVQGQRVTVLVMMPEKEG